LCLLSILANNTRISKPLNWKPRENQIIMSKLQPNNYSNVNQYAWMISELKANSSTCDVRSGTMFFICVVQQRFIKNTIIVYISYQQLPWTSDWNSFSLPNTWNMRMKSRWNRFVSITRAYLKLSKYAVICNTNLKRTVLNRNTNWNFFSGCRRIEKDNFQKLLLPYIQSDASHPNQTDIILCGNSTKVLGKKHEGTRVGEQFASYFSLLDPQPSTKQ